MEKQKNVIKYCLALLVLAIFVSLFSTCSSSASDLIPKDDLPEGITFGESADTTDCNSLPGNVGGNVVSFSQAIYDCDQPGDAYVLIMECGNEEAATEMLNELDNDVLDNSIYSKKPVVLNETEAIEAHTSSPPEYVFLWQEDYFVFLVMGTSRDDAFTLASIVEQR